jgi:hypothetical protein
MSNLVSAADLAALFHAVMSGVLIAFTTLVGIFTPRLIAAIERRTGVAITAQEREAVQASITTAAGILKTRLDQGTMRVGEVSATSAVVQHIAQDALDRVPDAAAAQGTSLAAAVQMIVGAVDTSRPAPAVVVANGAAIPVTPPI